MLQTTLQPLHHQLKKLTYGGVIAMDVSGQDMKCVPSNGKAPQRVKVKRSIGQEKKTDKSSSNRSQETPRPLAMSQTPPPPTPPLPK